MIVESLLELLRATPHQLHNMPFSELIRFAKGKVDPTNLPSDISIQGESSCRELVWENGQVTMRNQAIRERKGSSSNNPKPAKNSKAKFSSIDSVLNDFPLSAPPCDMSLDEDDDTVPWLNCPVVEPFNNVYCSDILPESFGVSGSEFAHSNSTAAKAPRSANSDLGCSEFKNSTAIKLQKNNSGQPNNNASGIMNFSYFSQFAANCKQTAGNEKSNHMGSAFVKSSVGFSQQESAPPKSDSSPPEQSVARCREKAVEPAVATSSVCSGNSLERDSSNPLSSLKRKCFETGDSEGPSEEVEDESVGVQKTAPSRSGSKRSRAAEVHNQSERRRRERINEKMRALQELIPNCNKVDKASMLDEAIEYLKTLQLQVQILSMGTGMYMSQMMLPAALQHMHRAHMPQFSAMGMGMGAALGFGMSMQPDVNSMMQMPCIQPPYFPSSGFYGAMSSSSHQTLANLGQGLSASMGNVSGMPLPNTSMNQLPNQETMVINDQFQASNVNEAQKH